MHTEKNIAEALWATIMETKKARVDLAMLCDRPKQEMQPPRGARHGRGLRLISSWPRNIGEKYLNRCRH